MIYDNCVNHLACLIHNRTVLWVCVHCAGRSMHNVLRAALLQIHFYKWRLSNNKMISVPCVKNHSLLPMQTSTSGTKYDLKTHQGFLGCTKHRRGLWLFVTGTLAHKCAFEEKTS